MILGTGIDQIETRRIAGKLEAEPSLKNTLFAAGEISYCESKAFPFQHYAARFAAKEAFMKALGTGWRNGMAFHEIAICHNTQGQPHLELSGKALQLAQDKGISKMHISLTHGKEIASAIVILEDV
jgi:holo-[acyl-carrier protein] synthase